MNPTETDTLPDSEEAILEYCDRAFRKCEKTLAAANKEANPEKDTIDLQFQHLLRINAWLISQEIAAGNPIPTERLEWLTCVGSADVASQ